MCPECCLLRCVELAVMIRHIRAALLRHCHIILLHAAAAAVLLCMLLPVLDSRNHLQLKVQEGPRAEFGRDLTSFGDNVATDLPQRNQVWLYSLIGTDFPGDLSALCCIAATQSIRAYRDEIRSL
jgi:hypothetical protein